MKKSIVYVLVLFTFFIGLPDLSNTASLPRPMNAQEKARLMALNDPALLVKKGGDGIPGIPPPPPPSAQGEKAKPSKDSWEKKDSDPLIPILAIGGGVVAGGLIFLAILAGGFRGVGGC